MTTNSIYHNHTRIALDTAQPPADNFAQHYFLSTINRVTKACLYPFNKYCEHLEKKALYSEYLKERARYYEANDGKSINPYHYKDRVIGTTFNTRLSVPLEDARKKEQFISLFGQKAKDVLGTTPIFPKLEDAESFLSFAQREPKLKDYEHVLVEDRIKLRTPGNCQGMSLDFIFQYLSQLKTGKTPMKALQSIASRYANGTPDDAWFLQIVFRALLTNRNKLPIEEAKKTSHAIEGECCQKAAFQHRLWYSACLSKKNEYIAKIAGLQKISSQIEMIFFSELKQSLPLLPDHAYLIIIAPENGPGHAIVLIKSSGNFFLFDPNRGIVSLKKGQEAYVLWDLSKRDRDRGKCYYFFTPYELADSSQIPSAQS